VGGIGALLAVFLEEAMTPHPIQHFLEDQPFQPMFQQPQAKVAQV